MADLSCRLPEDVSEALEREAAGVKGGKSAIVVRALRFDLGLDPDGAVSPLDRITELEVRVEQHDNRLAALEELAESAV